MFPLDVHPRADGLRPVADDPLFIRLGSLEQKQIQRFPTGHVRHRHHMVPTKISAFSFYTPFLVPLGWGTELRLEPPMRSEGNESRGFFSLVPAQNLLHCALQVVVAQDREHSTEIEKRSFMRFQKCLLAGVREGAMESSSAGHAPHAKHIGLLSLFPDVRVGFVPVHLGFLSPTVRLRNERFLPHQLQLNFSLANVASNGRLGHLYLWHLRVNPLPDAMRCVSLLLGGLLVCFQNRLDEGSRRP